MVGEVEGGSSCRPGRPGVGVTCAGAPACAPLPPLIHPPHSRHQARASTQTCSAPTARPCCRGRGCARSTPCPTAAAAGRKPGCSWTGTTTRRRGPGRWRAAGRLGRTCRRAGGRASCFSAPAACTAACRRVGWVVGGRHFGGLLCPGCAGDLSFGLACGLMRIPWLCGCVAVAQGAPPALHRPPLTHPRSHLPAARLPPKSPTLRRPVLHRPHLDGDSLAVLYGMTKQDLAKPTRTKLDGER